MDNKNFSTMGLVGLLGEVRRPNNFVLTIDGVSSGNNLELIVQRASLPQSSISVLELRRGNTAKKYAGVGSFQSGTIEILDTLSRKEFDAIMAWYYSVLNPETGEAGLSSDYKKDGVLTEYASDGRYQRKWKIKGMWPSAIQLGELNAESSELRKISITVEHDPSSLIPEYQDSVDTAWENGQ